MRKVTSKQIKKKVRTQAKKEGRTKDKSFLRSLFAKLTSQFK